MSRKPYPVYKPTGVEWLGDVPETWSLGRLGFRFKLQGGYAFSSEKFEPDGIPIVQMNSIVDQRLQLDNAKCVSKGVPGFNLRAGDIIIGMTGSIENIAKVKLDDLPAQLNQRVGRFIRCGNSNSDFLWYLLQTAAFRDFVRLEARGTAQANISSRQIEGFVLCIPNLFEQAQIANFLDRETAKIDELIAKKRDLIERLKEKRTALISHVVTKGLPPEEAAKHGLPVNPPLKPSGVPWLGHIPEHWELISLKRCVAIPITDGPHLTPNFVSEGIPFLSAEGVYDGRVNLESVRGFISPEDDAEFSKKCKPRIEDVLVVKSGSTTGKVGYVGIEDDFNIWSPLALVRAGFEDVGRFLFYALSSDYFFGQVKVSWSFGTQPNIGMDVLQNLKVVRPPRHEQIEIARFLDAKCESLDAVIVRTTQAIDKLKEYRSALITAAVTGKIDIREEVPA